METKNVQFAKPGVQAGARITPTFFGKVMFFFGLAIFMSCVGAYAGFVYFLPKIIISQGIIYGIFALELILVFTARLWMRRRPINYILFSIFTLLTGITIAPLLAVTIAEFGGMFIVKALLATTLMFTACAILGWAAKTDFMGLRGWLFMFLIGMIIVSVIGIFIPWSNTFEMIFSGIGVGLFSIYTMVDFQMIRKTHNEEYAIDAALRLYLDIFNLFIYILRLTTAMRRN